MGTTSPTTLRVRATDRTTIVCDRYGAGPTTVVVHGTLQDARAWSEVAALCASTMRLLVVNRRGRPPSGPLGGAYGLDTELDDLHAVLDTAGPTPALVGHSYGAVIALLAAMRRDDLRALVLYEPPLLLGAPVSGPALGRIRAALDADDLDRALEIVLTEVVRRSRASIAELRAIDEAWADVRSLVPTAYAELTALDALALDLGLLGDLGVPTTVLLGERSDRTRYGAPAHAVAAAIPGARLVRLAEQGHLAHMEAPHLVAGEIAQAVTAPPRLPRRDPG